MCLARARHVLDLDDGGAGEGGIVEEVGEVARHLGVADADHLQACECVAEGSVSGLVYIMRASALPLVFLSASSSRFLLGLADRLLEHRTHLALGARGRGRALIRRSLRTHLALGARGRGRALIRRALVDVRAEVVSARIDRADGLLAARLLAARLLVRLSAGVRVRGVLRLDIVLLDQQLDRLAGELDHLVGLDFHGELELEHSASGQCVRHSQRGASSSACVGSAWVRGSSVPSGACACRP